MEGLNLANRKPNYSPYPGDIVPAQLEPGEVVMNRNAVNHYGKEKLEAMNESQPRYPVGMQQGGDPTKVAIANARQKYFDKYGPPKREDMIPRGMFLSGKKRGFTERQPGNEFTTTYSYPESGGVNVLSHRPRSQADIFGQMMSVEKRYRHMRPSVNGVNQYELEMEPLQDAYIKKGLQYNNKPVEPFHQQEDSGGQYAKNAAIMDAKIVAEGKKRAKIDEMMMTGPSITQLDIRRGPSKISYDSIQPVNAPHLPQGLELDRSGKQIWDSVASKSDALPSWDELNVAGTTEVPKEDVDSNEWKQAQHWAQKLNESDYMFAPQDVKDAISKRDSLMDMVKLNQERDELGMDIEEEIHAPNRARLAREDAMRLAQREQDYQDDKIMPEELQRKWANYALPGHKDNHPLNSIMSAIDGDDDGQKMGAYTQWVVGSGGTPSDILNYRHLAKKQGATDKQLEHIDDGYQYAFKERYGEPEELALRRGGKPHYGDPDYDPKTDFADMSRVKSGKRMPPNIVGNLKTALQRFAIGVQRGANPGAYSTEEGADFNPNKPAGVQEGGYIGPDGRQHLLLGGAAALYGLGKASQWAQSGKPKELWEGAGKMWQSASDMWNKPAADPALINKSIQYGDQGFDDPLMALGAGVGGVGRGIYEGGKAGAGMIGAGAKYLWEGRDDEEHPGGGLKGFNKWGTTAGKGGTTGYQKIKKGAGKSMGFIGTMMKEAAAPGYLDMAMSGGLDKTKGDIGITVETAGKKAPDKDEVTIAQVEGDKVQLDDRSPTGGASIATPGVSKKAADQDDIDAGDATELGEAIDMKATDTRQYIVPDVNTEDQSRVQFDAEGNQLAVKGEQYPGINVNDLSEVDLIDPLAGGRDNTNVAKSAANHPEPYIDETGEVNYGLQDAPEWLVPGEKPEDIVDPNQQSTFDMRYEDPQNPQNTNPDFIGPPQVNPNPQANPQNTNPLNWSPYLDPNPMDSDSSGFGFPYSKGGIVRAMRTFVSGRGRKWDGRNRRRYSPKHMQARGKRHPLHNRRQSDKIPIKLQRGGAVQVANRARRMYG